VIRTFLAEARIVVIPDSRGQPNSPLFVPHRVVYVRLGIPERLVSPIMMRAACVPASSKRTFSRANV
jgi:hypothetical protein